MISEHFDAVKAQLETAPGLAGKVFDTVRLDSNGGLTRDNYVVLYRSVPDAIVSGRFNAVATADSELTFTVDVRVVGTSAGTAGLAMDQVLTALTGFRLTIAGRACSPLVLESSSRVAPDTSVKPFLYYADVGFELVSRPA